MYQAELRGKLSRKNENAEDILTSNVFSFFLYAPREVFLLPLLRLLELDVTPDEARDAEFLFWPVFDERTEPDLVILVGDYYLLVEAKYRSGFGEETLTQKHQLQREIEGGVREAQTLDKEFHLAAITAHYSYPGAELSVLPSTILPRFKWLNWQAITLLLEDVLEREKQLEFGWRALAADLYALLERRNFRRYAGPAQLSIKDVLVPLAAAPLFFDQTTVEHATWFKGFSVINLPATRLEPVDDVIFFTSTRLDRVDDGQKRVDHADEVGI